MTRVIDSYELTPMQAGMLFHRLNGGDRGIDVMQIFGTLHEALDEARFLRAWQRVVERHAVLRSRFRWEGIERPVQEVIHQVQIPTERLDWSRLAEAERHQRWEDLLDSDRGRGIDLDRAPLMRLVLVRAAENEHRILWTYHHAILDGRARLLLLREVFAVYEAYSRGEDAELPPTRPYREFVEWLHTLNHESARAYWQDALAGFQAPTPLVVGRTDEAVGAGGTNRGSSELRLSTKLTAALRERARDASVTLNTLLQGAWALLLFRYSGESDIVFGATRAGRGSAIGGAQDMVGLFINTLPIRVSVPPEAELVPWLRQLRAQQVALRDHEQTPLVMVQGWSDVPRGTPLFESILVFENQTLDAQLRALGEAWRERRFDYRGQTNFPLTVFAYGDAELLLRIEYSRRRFADDAIARMSGHLRILLEAMVASPNSRISELPLLTDAERHQLQVEWNDTAADYPSGALLHEFFEAQVAHTPGRTAFRTGATALSFAELDARANRVAQVLRARGVGRGQRVGLCVERDAAMLAAVLGILKAGAAYVPLDPSFPAERLRFMAHDAQLGLLVSTAALAEPFGMPRERQLLLDADARTIASAPDTRLPVNANTARPEDPAYVIYTSGSTGKPKGVVVPHRAVVNFLTSMAREPGLTADDVLVAVTTLSFDIAVLELQLPLAVGATVVIASRDEATDGQALRALLQRYGATVMQATPVTWRLLIEAGWTSKTAFKALVGGEALPKDLADQLIARGVELWNMYGPTETTVWSTCSRISDTTGGITIGRPIANTTVHVLDGQMNLCPIGVPGELYIGGVGVAVGYWNQPELTEERFVSDPFDRSPGARLYRTGDRACWRRDGTLEHLGRLDFQIKLRGFRIELGEIETRIAQHSAVREVVVIVREDVPRDQRLVAYVVAESPPADFVEQLRALLRSTLPEYMVPAHVVTLDALPLTENRKVNRKLLPAPDRSTSTVATDASPRAPIEEILAGIWADVLGIAQIGMKENFFELGGHSLLAMQVVSRVRQAFSVELSPREIFAAPTVSELSARLEALRLEARPVRLLPPLKATAVDGPTPLSFSQEGMWYLDQFEPGAPTYVIAQALELHGALDAALMERALGALVSRHEPLRTVFVDVAGVPQQIVTNFGAWMLPIVDLRRRGYTRERLEKFLSEEAARGFELARGPLFRGELYRLADDTHVLLLTMHHMVSDGWSMEVLLRELAALYGDLARGGESRLPPPRVHFRDFARWQREWLEGAALDRLLAYWCGRLAGAPLVLELPTVRPRPSVESHRGAHYRFTLPPDLVQRLHKLARREGATLFMTLLSGFALLLSRYTNQQDLLIGTPVANRNRSEIEGLVGAFVNTLVLRADLSGEPTAREFLARMREVCLDAYAHQDVPLDRLVEKLQPERDTSRNPVFQVFLALEKGPQRVPELPGLTLNQIEVHTGTAKFDLTLIFHESAEELRGDFEYATDLFDEPSIARMAGHLRSLLEAISATPERRISNLPLLTEAERHQLLVEWNDTAIEYPANVLLHEMFEEQVERTPDSVEVVFEGQHLTNRELDARANQLAHFLQKRGVGPDTLVAICIERSLEMVVGVLGVLKAGGAYVPLDPDLPRQRIAHILEETKSPVVLTQQRLQPQLPLDRARTICLDTDWADVAREPMSRAPSRAKANNLAYVIYTSGSTGRPKGVMITHAGICNHMYWMKRTHALSAGDVELMKTPFGFDASLWELFAPLMTDATLVMARPGGHMDPAYLAEMILTHHVVSLQVTPSQLRMLLGEPAFWHCAPPLKRVYCGGEPLTKELCDIFNARLPQAKLYNLYGPTEGTIDATLWVCSRGSVPVTVPIGRPIDNVRAYIVGPQMQLLPIGVPGELLIGGTGLARGYLNDPKLTAERFIPDPFCTQQGAQLYKTGDIARYLPDGNIEFLGRLDHQVKIRGLRIELGEIEAGIAEHHAVRQVVVAAHEYAPDDKRLVAYVVAENPPPDLSDQLRALIRTTMPEYMVPAHFVYLAELPLTPVGKVDRKRLPIPEYPALKDVSYVAPRTPTEVAVAASWSKVLDIDRIGVHDNFFELGGHSLLLVRVVSELHRAYGVRIGVSEVIQQPTVERVASIIDREPQQEKRQSTVVPLRKGRRQPPVYFIYATPSEFHIAQHMGNGHPAFGIEVRWPLAWRSALAERRTSGYPSMEQLVAPYVAALCAHPGSSSCVIAGLSFGGLMAFEAAHQFQKQGGRVEFVVLVDTAAMPPKALQGVWHVWRQYWKQLTAKLTADWPLLWIGAGLRSAWHTARWLFGKASSRLRSFFIRPAPYPDQLSTVFDEQHLPLPWNLVERLYDEIDKSYRPRRLDSRGILLRTTPINNDLAIRPQDDSLGWSELFARGLEIRPLSGDHDSIFRELAPKIAREISELLERHQSNQCSRITIDAREQQPASPSP